METTDPKENEIMPPAIEAVSNDEPSAWNDGQAKQDDGPFVFQNTNYSPESAAENARRTGLAWSAGIVFFASIAFMLFLGWIADLLLGISPWGLVGGIVIGSIIGFIQFFRISSQIFARSDNSPSPKTLFKDDGGND
ncbi:MAG: AtpZ/AtpI family protein [Pyrinomonadaceae bacterium]